MNGRELTRTKSSLVIPARERIKSWRKRRQKTSCS